MTRSPGYGDNRNMPAFWQCWQLCALTLTAVQLRIANGIFLEFSYRNCEALELIEVDVSVAI